MKQRITYLLPQGSGISSTDIEVGEDHLKFSRAHEAHEEWRLTLALHELSEEVVTPDNLSHYYNTDVYWN